MRGTLAPRGRLALSVALVGLVGIAALITCAPSARGQATLFPYPGSQPVKRAAGDVSWGGSGWIVPPGGVIEWSISVVHDDASLSMVTTSIADDIPDPASGAPVAPFVLATDVLESPPTGTLSYDGNSLNLDSVDLQLGESYLFRFKNTVLSSATPGTVICNRGWVSYVGPEDSGNPVGIPPRYMSRSWNEAGVDAPTCVSVAAGANLAESTKAISDADGDGFIEPGETITFTITVSNTGTGDATSVVVTDTLAPAFSIVNAGQGGVISGQQVQWTQAGSPALGRLRPGTSTQLTITAIVACPATASLCNRAFITSTEITTAIGTDDPATATPGDATCLATARPILARSPMSVTDASGDGIFDAGEALTFTLLARNAGNAAASDVQVSLPVPANLVVVTPRDGGVLAAGIITWTAAGTPSLASIAPSASVSLSFDAIVDPGAADGATGCATATLTPAACAAGSSDDPGLPGASDPTCFLLSSRPELSFDLEAIGPGGSGVGEPSETIDYVLTIRHVSGAAASTATVNVSLPVASVLGGIVADDGGAVAGQSISWSSAATPSLASIDPGETIVLTARAVVACSAVDAASACATGTASAANMTSPINSDDPGLPGLADPSCFTVSAAILSSTLAATDAGADGVFDAGEGATLTVNVVNTGSASAREVIVTLPLSVADLNVVASNAGIVGPALITWNSSTTPALGSLDPAGSVTLSATLRIDPASAGGRTCHQASSTWAALPSCSPELSADPALGGGSSPTCWNVLGTGLPPGEVPDGDPLDGGPIPVRLACQGDDLVITWDRAPNGTLHHVYRGAISSFRARPWINPAASISDPENAAPSCDLGLLSYRDESECAVGGISHYFLIQGKNLVGVGPLGESVTNAGASERPPVTGPCP